MTAEPSKTVCSGSSSGLSCLRLLMGRSSTEGSSFSARLRFGDAPPSPSRALPSSRSLLMRTCIAFGVGFSARKSVAMLRTYRACNVLTPEHVRDLLEVCSAGAILGRRDHDEEELAVVRSVPIHLRKKTMCQYCEVFLCSAAGDRENKRVPTFGIFGVPVFTVSSFSTSTSSSTLLAYTSVILVILVYRVEMGEARTGEGQFYISRLTSGSSSSLSSSWLFSSPESSSGFSSSSNGAS